MQTLRLFPPLAVMALIFALSHQPGSDLPLLFPHFDKLAHFFVYGLLAATVIAAWQPQARQSRPKAVALAAIFCCLAYGIFDEFHQSFIPGRHSSVADVVFDVLGGLSVSLAWLGLAARRLNSAAS